MRKQAEEYIAGLSAECVDECSQKVRDFLTELQLPKRDILRYSMSVEEILLGSLDVLNDEAEIKLSMGKKYLSYFIVIEINGAACNVYAKNDDELGVLGGSLLKNLGLSPEYKYAGDRNRYSFIIKPKRLNPFAALALTAAAAVLIGSLGYILPTPTRETLLNSVLIPLNDAFLDLLGCIAGPMIFLSVAWGIYGIGDAATLKNIGKRLCSSYILTMTVIASVLCLLLMSVFELSFTGGGASTDSSLSAIFSMILGIIPKDIFSPFVSGNTLQIIALAVVVGIAMLFLGQKTDFVAKVVEQINYIVQFLIGAICRLVPAFIFIVLLKLIWSDMISSLSGIGKLFGAFIVATLLSATALIVFTAVKNKASPVKLIKKGLPTLLVALSTASSAAAFSNLLTGAHRSYGIDEKLSSFGVPLGVVIFKPTAALNYVFQCLFFAEMYSIDISASWIVIMLLTSVLLAIATPPIPGGGMATYAVLFAQLGIPTEALAIALSCETVLDFIITGFDQFGISFVLLNMASKLGFVDRETLLK